MTKTKDPVFVERSTFEEDFWNFEENKTLTGVFLGFITKEMENRKGVKESRQFAKFQVEGYAKPQIAGGADLIGKLRDEDKGKAAQIEFLGMEKFTPKGSKVKQNIKRFRVSVAA